MHVTFEQALMYYERTGNSKAANYVRERIEQARANALFLKQTRGQKKSVVEEAREALKRFLAGEIGKEDFERQIMALKKDKVVENSGKKYQD